MNINSLARHAAIAAAAGGLALAFGAQAGEDKIQMMDANKDGMISAAEHTAGARQMFQKMDADGDGRVTAAEMDAAHHHDTRDGGTPASAMSSAEKIATIDADKDGAITASEHEAGSRGMFSRMDANGDGNLNAAELRAGHQKMMGEQPH